MGAKIISRPRFLIFPSADILTSSSLLPRFLCRRRARDPCRYGVFEEDRNGLLIGERHGPQGVLRSDGFVRILNVTAYVC